MNQNTNNLITIRSFCDKNVYNFHNCLKMSLGILFTVANVCKVRSHGSNESWISISVQIKKNHCHDKL